jgi:hypothetical protein
MSADELIGKIPTKTKDRYFKIGDIIRWVPKYVTKENGMGIVVSATGPLFEAYWVGTKEIKKHDARGPSSFLLQDITPIPQVAETINRMRSKKA